MPYPTDMAQIRYDFSWKTTEEIQSISLWGKVAQEGGAAFPDWQDVVNALAQKAIDAWVEQMEPSHYSQGVKGQRAVTYHYDQPLKEVLHRGEAAFDPENSWSGSGSSSLPPQNTLVASLYAYDPAGYAQQRARKRGRIYLPTPSPAQVDGTGQLSQGTVANWATMVQGFINALTGELDVQGGSPVSHVRWRPYVVSVAGSFASQVTFVRVGSVVDTQRRRRNQLTEAYETRGINVV